MSSTNKLDRLKQMYAGNEASQNSASHRKVSFNKNPGQTTDHIMPEQAQEPVSLARKNDYRNVVEQPR